MTGTYTEILAIVAPDEAEASSTVNVAVGIENIWTATIHVYCVAVLDSESRFIDWLDAWISPGETYYFNGSFVMPDKDVRINAYGYFVDTDGNLQLDDSLSKDVRLSAAPPVPEPTISKFTIADYVKV